MLAPVAKRLGSYQPIDHRHNALRIGFHRRVSRAEVSSTIKVPTPTKASYHRRAGQLRAELDEVQSAPIYDAMRPRS